MRPVLVLLASAAIFFTSLQDNWGGEPEVRFNLLTLPSARAVEKRLQMPARLAYENVTLRACMAQLAEHFQFSYWIDRHVDGEQRISLSMRDATLHDCLIALARAANADMGVLENVVTIASPDRLAAMQYTAVRLHDQLSRDDREGEHRAVMRPLQWEMLTTPSELAIKIGQAWSFDFPTVALPHDLMNAGTLQPCTLSTQLTLLLGGFDLCAAGVRPKALRVVALPTAAAWRATYARAAIPAENLARLPDILAEFSAPPDAASTGAQGTDAQSTAVDGTLTSQPAHVPVAPFSVAQFPVAQVTNASGQVQVIGTTALHLRLLARRSTQPEGRTSSGTSSSPESSGTRSPPSEKPRRAPRRGGTSDSAPSDPLADQRITFPKFTDQAADAVLAALAKQLAFDVQWDPAILAADRRVLVSLEANAQSLDVLLAQLAKQTRFDITRLGTAVVISPSQTAR